MRPSLLFLLISSLTLFFSLAEPHAVAVPRPDGMAVQSSVSVGDSIPFHAVKNIPDYASQAVPKGGHTKFYGEIEIAIGSETAAIVRLHFFEWTTKLPGYQDDARHCGINVYVKKARHARFHLAAEIRKSKDAVIGVSNPNVLDYSFGAPVLFVEMMWLAPATQKTPVIRICCQEQGSYWMGENIFLTFNKGLSSPPTTQTFTHYSTMNLMIDWFFDGRDERGRRRFAELEPAVVAEASDANAVGDQAYWWNWDDQELEFKPVEIKKAPLPATS